MSKFIIEPDGDTSPPYPPPPDLTPSDSFFESEEFGKIVEELGDQLDLNITE